MKKNNNYVLDQLIGGWHTAATIQYQSRNPFTVCSARSGNLWQQFERQPLRSSPVERQLFAG